MAMKGNVRLSIWASFLFPLRRTLPKILFECPDWDSFFGRVRRKGKRKKMTIHFNMHFYCVVNT